MPATLVTVAIPPIIIETITEFLASTGILPLVVRGSGSDRLLLPITLMGATETPIALLTRVLMTPTAAIWPLAIVPPSRPPNFLEFHLLGRARFRLSGRIDGSRLGHNDRSGLRL